MNFAEDIPDESFVLAKLDRLMGIVRAKSDAFERQLDALPPIIPCPKHAQEAMLNKEASYKAAEAVYECPECARAAHLGRLSDRISAAGIPADVRHATLANFEFVREGVKTGQGFKGPHTFLSAAREFSNRKVRNLILAGTPGIGKGHLAAALSIQTITEGGTVAWIECSRLFTLFHKAYATSETEEIVERYAKPVLLVIDELCMRDLPADGEEILFAVLDRRHKAGRQTIMLGNKAAAETRTWLGGRIYDRLKSGGVLFCYGEWQSMRGQANDGASDEF